MVKIAVLTSPNSEFKPAGDTFDKQMKQGLIEGWWFDPGEDKFQYLIISMYKWPLGKPNMEFGKS